MAWREHSPTKRPMGKAVESLAAASGPASSVAMTKVYSVAGCGPAVAAILRRSSALLRGRQYGGPNRASSSQSLQAAKMAGTWDSARAWMVGAGREVATADIRDTSLSCIEPRGDATHK